MRHIKIGSAEHPSVPRLAANEPPEVWTNCTSRSWACTALPAFVGKAGTVPGEDRSSAQDRSKRGTYSLERLHISQLVLYYTAVATKAGTV